MNTKTNDVKNYFFSESGFGAAFQLFIFFLLVKQVSAYMIQGRVGVNDLHTERVQIKGFINQQFFDNRS
jgi:hypothetical protein